MYPGSLATFMQKYDGAEDSGEEDEAELLAGTLDKEEDEDMDWAEWPAFLKAWEYKRHNFCM